MHVHMSVYVCLRMYYYGLDEIPIPKNIIPSNKLNSAECTANEGINNKC